MSIIVNPTTITLRKRLAGSNTDVSVTYTHAKDEMIDVMAYLHPTHGMRISVRAYSAGTWGDWAEWTTGEDVTAPAISALYNIGSTGATSPGFSGHLAADLAWTDLERIPNGLNAAGIQTYMEGLAA